MRAAISLLVLLFSMCGAQTLSTQTEVQTESQSTGAAAAAAEVSTQLDVSAELRELRDMVVELRVTLKFTQDDLETTKTQLNKMETANTEQETKLIVMAERLEASETKVGALERGLVASETKVENAAQEAELTAVKIRLAATETEVDHLETEIKAAPKVAFSAGLTDSGFRGSGSTDLNLVFSRVITNVGQAYNSGSGFFTAPVRGVYYFRFTVRDDLSSRAMTIRMCKNGQQLMYLWESDTDGSPTYLSSGLTLQLEVGDVVNMVLPAGYRLFDDVSNYCTFSGFLLFPL
ncbi:hypothetical protein ACEWY4_002261 [Coilia grayii]|uniref:C1q domain-containing protein n=1 Tax=Coilia grayii TaxID=363190 RepID=A0ABD1KVA3_9TELE